MSNYIIIGLAIAGIYYVSVMKKSNSNGVNKIPVIKKPNLNEVNINNNKTDPVPQAFHDDPLNYLIGGGDISGFY